MKRWAAALLLTCLYLPTAQAANELPASARSADADAVAVRTRSICWQEKQYTVRAEKVYEIEAMIVEANSYVSAYTKLRIQQKELERKLSTSGPFGKEKLNQQIVEISNKLKTISKTGDPVFTAISALLNRESNVTERQLVEQERIVKEADAKRLEEQERIAKEAEAKKKAEEDRLAAEKKQKQEDERLAKEAENQRLAQVEQEQKAKQEEEQRLANIEQVKKATLAEEQRLAGVEQDRLKKEAEKLRLAKIQADKQPNEDEIKRVAEAQRIAQRWNKIQGKPEGQQPIVATNLTQSVSAPNLHSADSLTLAEREELNEFSRACSTIKQVRVATRINIEKAKTASEFVSVLKNASNIFNALDKVFGKKSIGNTPASIEILSALKTEVFERMIGEMEDEGDNFLKSFYSGCKRFGSSPEIHQAILDLEEASQGAFLVTRRHQERNPAEVPTSGVAGLFKVPNELSKLKEPEPPNNKLDAGRAEWVKLTSEGAPFSMFCTYPKLGESILSITNRFRNELSERQDFSPLPPGLRIQLSPKYKFVRLLQQVGRMYTFFHDDRLELLTVFPIRDQRGITPRDIAIDMIQEFSSQYKFRKVNDSTWSDDSAGVSIFFDEHEADIGTTYGFQNPPLIIEQ